MSLLRKPFLVAIIAPLLVLCGCGFQPVYGNLGNGKGADVTGRISRVEIASIPDREGVYLRNLLVDAFYLDGRPAAPLYTLKINRIDESQRDLDITKTSDATRGQLRLETTMTLRDADGARLFGRELVAIASYNILASEFANRVSEENARKNALGNLARQIENHLSLYLLRTGPNSTYGSAAQ